MEPKLTNQESLFIDYAKALGIVLVLMGHYQWNPLNIYKPYIYHMPLFFIIGGFVIKPIRNKFNWLSDITKKYLIYLSFWYVSIAVFTLCINHFFPTSIGSTFFDKGKLNLITYPITHNMHNNRLFLIAWFILAYFLASSLFKIKISLLKFLNGNQYGKKIFLIFGLIVGYISMEFIAPAYQAKRYWFYNLLCQVGVGYMFISIGYFVRPYMKYFSSIPILILSIAMMFTFSGNGTFKILVMSWSKYPNGFFLHVISAMVGCFGLLSLAYIISLAVNSRLLKWVGCHSKDIMTLHLFSFVLVDLIFCRLGYFKYENIQALKHFSHPSVWGIYIGFGLVFPITIRIILDKTKAYFFTTVKKISEHLI